ncbi:hypothetical protein FP2506_09731 [Fulvimarina pelagi HTCC2506]|uniref:Uncharacterized protein n=1 Tax=Fulvimarina pelagi HTCC2506 TaxID=314231 RepID=Q0G5F0_9HYPH|nr:hypothetical protein FP2506_09731 [Fulvimarina pelagi HTCC2506]
MKARFLVSCFDWFRMELERSQALCGGVAFGIGGLTNRPNPGSLPEVDGFKMNLG